MNTKPRHAEAGQKSASLRFDMPIDFQQLLRRCLGNERLAEQVIAKFDSGIEAEVARLENALLRRDAEQLAAVAHRLKGAAASVSADRLRDAAGGIEREARAGHFQQASNWIAQFIREGRSLSRYVKAGSGIRIDPGA